MKIFGVLEIRLITKKVQVEDVLKTKGKLKAIKKCKELFGYDLTRAKQYVDRLVISTEQTQ